MKTSKFLTVATSLALAGASFAFITGQQEEPGMEKPPMDEMPMMEKPTDQHKALLEGVGDYVGVMKFMAPGAPVQELPCTETVEAFGEFWVQSEFKCAFAPGFDYIGRGTFCLLYTSPSPRDQRGSRMPSSA